MTTVQLPVEVFYCYTSADEELRQQLDKHLSLLRRQGIISTWHNRLIVPGTEHVQAIDMHLNSASIILLLISADFLNSDYCYDVEMKRALERHRAGEARVIPILLRSISWHYAPFMNLHTLPTNAKPIANWSNSDDAFTNVADGIHKAIIDMSCGVGNNTTLKQEVFDESGVSKISTATTQPQVPPKQKFHFIFRGVIKVIALFLIIIIGILITIILAMPSKNINTIPINLSFKAVSSPHYANVEVTLVSVSSSQQGQINFSFKNNGIAVCQHIKFHTITLKDANKRYHILNQANQEWTLNPGETLSPSSIFQEPLERGFNYTLQISLDVGGCINPLDTSSNKYANYQTVSFSL